MDIRQAFSAVALSGVLLCGSFLSAQANLVISTGASGTGDNVLFKNADVSGMTVTTLTNKGISVTFTGNEELGGSCYG